MSQPQNNRTSTPPPVLDAAPSLADVQRENELKRARLLDLELIEKTRAAELFEAERKQREIMARESFRSTQAKIEAQLAAERNCHHLRDDGKNATRANRGGDGRNRVYCMKCNKAWRENEYGQIMGWSSDPHLPLPQHLFPRQGESGGFAGFA